MKHRAGQQEVRAAPHHVVRCRTVAVVLIRQQQQLEVLVGLDQRVRDEQRLKGRHVGVHRAMREQQVPFQVLRKILVRLEFMLMLAPSVARWKSGSICKRVIVPCSACLPRAGAQEGGGCCPCPVHHEIPGGWRLPGCRDLRVPRRRRPRLRMAGAGLRAARRRTHRDERRLPAEESRTRSALRRHVEEDAPARLIASRTDCKWSRDVPMSDASSHDVVCR